MYCIFTFLCLCICACGVFVHVFMYHFCLNCIYIFGESHPFTGSISSFFSFLLFVFCLKSSDCCYFARFLFRFYSAFWLLSIGGSALIVLIDANRQEFIDFYRIFVVFFLNICTVFLSRRFTGDTRKCQTYKFHINFCFRSV